MCSISTCDLKDGVPKQMLNKNVKQKNINLVMKFM